MTATTPTLGKDRPIIFSAPMVRALLDAYEGGHTIAELASKHGVSRPTIAKQLKAAGAIMRPAVRRPGVGVGSDNPAWRGGRRLRRDGYWLVWTPKGERLEHRVVAEKEIGRPLRCDEIVHHRDGDKGNNAPSNLQVMSQHDHARHHAPEMHAARYRHGR